MNESSKQLTTAQTQPQQTGLTHMTKSNITDSSREQSNINFISDKMKTLQVPDNRSDETSTSSPTDVAHSSVSVAPKLPPCQYIKDNKLYFHEVKLRAENHNAVAEKMMFFRNFRAQIEETLDLNQAIEIPPVYVDLIAALVQDSDESSASTLAGRINELLSPFLRKEPFASKFHNAIETVINQIAYRCTYGLRPDVYANLISDTQQLQQQQQQQCTTPPQHLCIHRWEVHNINLFPADMQQVINARRLIRQMLTDSVTSYICELPKESRQQLLFPPKKQRHSRQNTAQHNQQHQQQPPDIIQTAHIETEEEKEKRLKKEEEKRKKEEEKRQREEDRKRREEEKRKKEEEKRKKEQSQLRLTSLFAKQMSAASVSTSTSTSSTSNNITMDNEHNRLLESSKPTLFPPFYIKENVTIANPYPLLSQTKNSCTIAQSAGDTAQDEFKKRIHLSASSPSSDSMDVKQDFLSQLSSDSKQKRGVVNTQIDIRTLLLPGSADLMTIPNVRLILKMKLIQFNEDVRPAYYGTWTNKKSHIITSKQPLAKDTAILDYDIDSEAEWEPEDAEGEDIHSGDEQDDAEDNDMLDPEDAGWLVPEGYLSDSEGVDEDDDEDDRKIKYSKSGSSYRKTRPTIRKIVMGPFFEDDESNSNLVEDEAFKLYETQLFIDIPKDGYDPFHIETSSTNNTSTSGSTTEKQSTSSTTSNKMEFTDAHRSALISVINEKPTESIPNLIQEAKANSVLKDVSKRQLEMNIKNIAVKEKRGSDKKPSWYIRDTAAL